MLTRDRYSPRPASNARARKFWLTAPNGDMACVDFEQQPGGFVVTGMEVRVMPNWQTFFVDIGVVPVPTWD